MREAIAGYSDKYRLCRLWGHAWEPTTVDGSQPRVWVQGLRCTRCETERRVPVSRRNGVSMGNRYKYNPDYRIEGLTATDKNQLRKFEIKHRLS